MYIDMSIYIKENKVKYAEVNWSIEDVHEYREAMGYAKWTDVRAGDFLAENEGILKDVMIQAGWEALSDLVYGE